MTSPNYTNLYFELVAEIKREEDWKKAQHWFVGLILLGWVLAAFSALLNPLYWRWFFFTIGGLITGLFLLLWLFFWLGYLAWAGSRDPQKMTPLLAAKLLTVVKRPYTKDRGLRLTDIQNLHDIAAAEQAAADWRGNFITLVIVGIVLGTVTSILAPSDALENLLRFIIELLQSPIPTNEIRPLPSITTPTFDRVLNWVSFTVVAGLFFIVLRQLVIYLDRFIATESANRAIIFTTQEASFLLERAQLGGERPLTLREKQHLALLLGFRLRTRQDFSVPLYVDVDNNWWHLDPVSDIDKIDRRSKNFIRFQKRVLRFLERFKKNG